MTLIYLLLSLASAAAFYLASRHQRLSARAMGRRAGLRAIAWAAGALAIVVAVAALGVVAGVFSALTAWMLGTVLLPYVDAWRQLRKGVPDVG